MGFLIGAVIIGMLLIVGFVFVNAVGILTFGKVWGWMSVIGIIASGIGLTYLFHDRVINTIVLVGFGIIAFAAYYYLIDQAP